MNILKFAALSCLLLPAMGLKAMDRGYDRQDEGMFSALYELPKTTYKYLWKKASWGRVATEGCVLGLLGAGIAYKCNEAFKRKVDIVVNRVKNNKQAKSRLKDGAIFTAGVVTAVTVPSLYTKMLHRYYGERYYEIYGEDNI